MKKDRAEGFGFDHWDAGAALPFLFSPVEKSVTETGIQNETNEGDGR
jgi:hypothetical protein